jgi:hypothetical protein
MARSLKWLYFSTPFLMFILFMIYVRLQVPLSEGEAGPFFLLGKQALISSDVEEKALLDIKTWMKAQDLACVTEFRLPKYRPNQSKEGEPQGFLGCLVNSEDWEKLFKIQRPEDFLVDQFPQDKYVIINPEPSVPSRIILKMKTQWPFLNEYGTSLEVLFETRQILGESSLTIQYAAVPRKD